MYKKVEVYEICV